MQPFGTAARIW